MFRPHLTIFFCFSVPNAKQTCPPLLIFITSYPAHTFHATWFSAPYFFSLLLTVFAFGWPLMAFGTFFGCGLDVTLDRVELNLGPYAQCEVISWYSTGISTAESTTVLSYKVLFLKNRTLIQVVHRVAVDATLVGYSIRFKQHRENA